MIRYQMKSETDQLNLRVDKTLIVKLQNLADKFNKRSKTQVAVEILEQYIELWEQVEDIKFKAIRKQRIALTNKQSSSSELKSSSDEKIKMEDSSKVKEKNLLDKLQFSSEREAEKKAQTDKEKADPKTEIGAKSKK